eukprot:gnl/MRDRNA2_/MRDRNA2_146865_c0_seq1.p1 gnl/MRDRNA2_/MRDRNA2_146865_c0~~gnl/MRDRNA2_/MRDRNA2_146865_c0_seq1.p1  ORF type:complete len:317 (+),score=63.99 gnl/MRDRNA2_/MRDRNA2_146865_c0_seq1:91-1041(+)
MADRPEEPRKHGSTVAATAGFATLLFCLYAVDFGTGGPITKADTWMRNRALPFLERKVKTLEKTYNDVKEQVKDEQRAEEAEERAEENSNKAVLEAELTEELAAQKLLKDGYVNIDKAQKVAHAEVEKEFRENPWAFKSDNQGAPPWAVCTIFALFYYCRVVVYSKRRGTGKEDWTDAQRREGLSKHGDDFRWGVTDCMSSQFDTCFLSFFCLHARAAHTWHKAGLVNYWVGCAMVQMCGALPVLCMRRRLRAQFRLESPVCSDYVVGILCTPCIVIQEARVVDEVCNAECEEDGEPLLPPVTQGMPMKSPMETDF